MNNLLRAAMLMACLNGFAQNEKQVKVIHSFIDGLNTGNYRQVKEHWDFIGRTLVSKKKLRSQYGAFFSKNGTGVIKDIVPSHGNSCTADVLFEQRKGYNKHVYFQFNFNDKDQVNGFGYGFPTFHYKKDSSGGSYDPGQLIAIVNNYKEQDGQPFNGCVYLTQNHKELLGYSKGYADKDRKILLNDSTRFQLASCSKPFTALAVLTLAEDGKLSPEDPVSKYLPDFPYENVRIKHLLSHTSGIRDYQQYLEKYRAENASLSNADVLSIYTENEIGLNFEPGSLFQYSNINFIILASLVEKVSGESFGSYMEKHVLKPLELYDTRVYTTRRDGELIDNYALGYLWDDASGEYTVPDSLENYAFVLKQDGLTGDDNVCSSVADMDSFLDVFTQQKLISEELMNAMCSPYRLSDGSLSAYGYGLGVIKKEGDYTIYSHSGSWPGYLTCFFSVPEKNIHLVILSNYSNEQVQLMANDLLQAILE